MKIRSVLKNVKASTFLDMLFSLLTIPLALAYCSQEFKAEAPMLEMRVIICFVFFFMALSRLFRARRFRLGGRQKSVWITQLVFAGVFLACSVLPVFVRYTRPIGLNLQDLAVDYCGDLRQLVSMIFWSATALGRVMAIVRNHKWRSLIPNILLILLIVVCALMSQVLCEIMSVMILVVIQTLVAIFAVVFRHLRTDVLKKIIRKTYASEIILGLLLLIFAFSYVMMYVEPNMGSIDEALWYCFAIVTTIGFGDIAAVTPIGRILSVILGIYGIIVVALITSVIVNFYGEIRKDSDDEEEHEDGEEREEKEG